MKNEKEVELIKEQFLKINPKKSFDKLPNKDCGINFILKYLWDNNNEAYTNVLAREMGASTARVSTLINKLEERGIVKRAESRNDARKTKIILTEKGIQCHKTIDNEVNMYLFALVDKIGVEELLHFIDIIKVMQITAIERIKENKKEEKDV